LGSLAANVASNFPNLLSKILFHYLPPNTPALTILVRAFYKESQLLAPLSDQRVESEQLRLQFEDLLLFAFH
jgi:hypothetical protein